MDQSNKELNKQWSKDNKDIIERFDSNRLLLLEEAKIFAHSVGTYFSQYGVIYIDYKAKTPERYYASTSSTKDIATKLDVIHMGKVNTYEGSNLELVYTTGKNGKMII